MHLSEPSPIALSRCLESCHGVSATRGRALRPSAVEPQPALCSSHAGGGRAIVPAMAHSGFGDLSKDDGLASVHGVCRQTVPGGP